MTDQKGKAPAASGAGERMWPPGGPEPAGPEAPVPPYIVRGRDLRVDLLRGYFVVAMVVDHVRGQSPLYLLTGGNRFFTSAAEGFILTSGLVAGIVYARLIARAGLGPAMIKILSRAATLYLLTVGVTLLFLPLSEILYFPWAQGVDLTDGFTVLMSVVTLHRTYYLIDVMLLYTVLFVLAPIAFALMDGGRTKIVLAASWILWGVYQVFPDAAALPWPVAGNYLFDFSAWQVLFVTGLVLGYHHRRLPALSARAARVALVGLGSATALLIAAYFVVDPPVAVMPPDLAFGSLVFHEARIWLQDMVFSKVSLRPGRLVASAITFTFMFVLVSVYWRRIQRFAAWLLIPLGQSALYAYTAHILLVTVVALALSPLQLAYPGPQWLNALIQVASVLVVWLLVRRKVMAPRPATERIWNAAPAGIFVAMLLLLAWYPTPAHPGLVDPPVQSSSAAQVPRRFGTPIPAAEVAAIRARRLPALPPLPTPTSTPAVPAATPAAVPTTRPPATPGTPAPGPAPATPTPTAARAVTPTPIPTSEARPAVPLDLKGRLEGYQVGPLDGSLEEHWLYSSELDRDMPYLIYLPPDYAVAGRRYPVMYLLHGTGGTRDEWLEMGFVDEADRAIRTADVPPMIFVMPQGDVSYWVNHAGDGARWGEYLTRDVVAHVDATYRTLRVRAARGVAGISMGAWGALSNTFAHPEIFGVVAGHSPSVRAYDGSLPFLGTEDEFRKVDPVYLASLMPADGSLQIWMDMGQDDPWLASATVLHDLLAQRGIEHNWQIYPGGHVWAYWHEHFTDYLRFYGHVLSPR